MTHHHDTPDPVKVLALDATDAMHRNNDNQAAVLLMQAVQEAWKDKAHNDRNLPAYYRELQTLAHEVTLTQSMQAASGHNPEVQLRATVERDPVTGQSVTAYSVDRWTGNTHGGWQHGMTLFKVPADMKSRCSWLPATDHPHQFAVKPIPVHRIEDQNRYWYGGAGDGSGGGGGGGGGGNGR